MRIPRPKPSVRRSADDGEITVYAIIVRVPGANEGDRVPIKVGCSAKPKELLRHMGLFCPFPIELVSIGMLPGLALVSRAMSELRRALEMASVEIMKERGDWYFCKPDDIESAFRQVRLG